MNSERAAAADGAQQNLGRVSRTNPWVHVKFSPTTLRFNLKFDEAITSHASSDRVLLTSHTVRGCDHSGWH